MSEQLLQDIATRLQAIGESVSEARIREIAEGVILEQSQTRKIKFGAKDSKLDGSKFARWQLNSADVEFLYDLMAARRSIGGPGPSEELQAAFAEISDAMYMTPDQVRQIDRQAIDNLFPRVHKRNRAQYEAAMRAMDTAESGYGSQLVGAQYVGDLWEAARTEMRVANLIGSFEMTAPTAYLPVEVDFPAMILAAESTSASSSEYDTQKTGSNRVTVSAVKLLIHQMWSGEMEEDSIIAFIPFLRAQAQKSLAFHMDSLALNGDTTAMGINSVDTSLAATVFSRAFDGIRHAALVDNTGNKSSAANAVVSLSHFRGAYSRMIDGTYLHDWGHPNSPNDVVHVVDPYTADQMLGIDEFLTQDKAGNRASLFTGQVATVYNHPVISSIALKKTDTTGFYDADTAGNNLYGNIVTFNRNGCKWGWRRRVQIETERLPARDQNRIVYSLRAGFGRFTPTGAASGIEWADVVYYLNL